MKEAEIVAGGFIVTIYYEMQSEIACNFFGEGVSLENLRENPISSRGSRDNMSNSIIHISLKSIF